MHFGRRLCTKLLSVLNAGKWSDVHCSLDAAASSRIAGIDFASSADRFLNMQTLCNASVNGCGDRRMELIPLP
ncbi:hypothetical protein T11_18488 [Trichinella zimbabwensis]|uniref:Uncharacterized protein n=1 Tax=Trichinella zimbabwensis TaxID=268475 RepID=A0A0V1GWT0_9BILA|nr:hypothetical protein T11_18488 [Trichinella zimbabwensis]